MLDTQRHKNRRYGWRAISVGTGRVRLEATGSPSPAAKGAVNSLWRAFLGGAIALFLVGFTVALPAGLGGGGRSVEAAPPKKITQTVYSLNLYDGKAFTGTMAPQAIKKIYLLADSRNVFNVMRTKVYWWDITSEWMIDPDAKKEPVEGTLEILQKGKVIRRLSPVRYTFRYGAAMSGAMRLLLGKEAQREFQAFKKSMDAYYAAYMKYAQQQAEYEKAMQEYMKNPKGKAPVQPEPPEAPTYYINELQSGYIVKLPQGDYQVRVRDKRGKVLPETVKNLQVFAPARQAIGYTLRTESKWTFPQDSLDPDREIYLASKEILYLTPFRESQFNAFLYTKLSKLERPGSGRGGEYIYKWEQLGNLRPGFIMEVVRAGKVVGRASLVPYRVQQIPGGALGYEIKATEAGKEHFYAYKIQLPGPGVYTLRLVDSRGKVLRGSARSVLFLSRVRRWPLVVLALLPLGILLMGSRRGRRSSEALE